MKRLSVMLLALACLVFGAMRLSEAGNTKKQSSQKSSLEILGKGVMGFEVYIDGNKAGVIDRQAGEFARFTSAIKPGRSHIELKKNGKILFSREIQVSKGSEYCLEASIAGAERNTGSSGSEIDWSGSLEHGLKIAGEQNKPLMVDFYTTWCHWCKKLDSDVYTDRSVINEASKFVCVRIDADQHKEEAAQYAVTGFPTVLFLNSDGSEINRVAGYLPSSGFLQIMSRAAPKTANNMISTHTSRLSSLKNNLMTAMKNKSVNIRNWAYVFFNRLLQKVKAL